MKKAIYKWLLQYVENHYWCYSKEWGRRFTGGEWYLMRTALPMGDIWSREKFTSCQANCIGIDSFNFGIKYIDQLS
jgi:hypothetical protein